MKTQSGFSILIFIEAMAHSTAIKSNQFYVGHFVMAYRLDTFLACGYITEVIGKAQKHLKHLFQTYFLFQ